MHRNEKAFRDALDAFNARDYETAVKFFSEDVVWHYPCRNPLQGVYKGRKGLTEFFEGLYNMTGGAITADTVDVLANDEHVARIARIHFEHEGQLVQWMGASICDVGPDGLITEAWIYEDDVEVAKIFEAQAQG